MSDLGKEQNQTADAKAHLEGLRQEAMAGVHVMGLVSAAFAKIEAEGEYYHVRLHALYGGEDWEKARALFDGKRTQLATHTLLSHSGACQEALRWTLDEMEAAK